MPDGKRLWRTASGSLVEDGHPDAVFLAYGPADAVNDEDKARLVEVPVKAVRQSQNKQAKKPADK